jgi:hypothetical protein
MIIELDDADAGPEREALLHVDGMQASGWYALVSNLEAPDAPVRAHGSERRERIATAALQALIARNIRQEKCSSEAAEALRYADALIAALDGPEGA